MKRAALIIIWALLFWLVALLTGSLVFQFLRFVGLISWPPPLFVSIIWTVIFFGSPLLALSLGSRGKLPGTQKSK